MCAPTQNNHSSPHRRPQARGQAGSTLRKGDTGQPPVQCQQQQGHPPAGRQEGTGSRHTRDAALSPGARSAGEALGTGTFHSAWSPSPAEHVHLSQSEKSNTQPGGFTAQGRFHSQAELSEHKLICNPHAARTTKGDIDSIPHGLSG